MRCESMLSSYEADRGCMRCCSDRCEVVASRGTDTRETDRVGDEVGAALHDLAFDKRQTIVGERNAEMAMGCRLGS
jgi:hypothetical protein